MRVDFQIRVVMDAKTYTEVGNVMDEIVAKLNAVNVIFEQHMVFDFVSFNTHPCKTMQMEHAVYHNESRAQLAEIGPTPDQF